MQAPKPDTIVRAASQPARDALRAEPLNPRALRLLALNDLLDSKPKAGIELLQLSERVSRRDLGTRLTLIEHYAAIGNVTAALDQYDLALSTSPGAGNALFPVLTGALAEPEIRAGLRQYIRSDRPWVRSFLAYATANANPPDDVARLVMASGGLPRHPDYRELESALLMQLHVKRRYDALRALYLALPNASPAMLRNVAITGETTNPALRPLTWNTIETPEISSQVDKDITVRVAPGSNGIALQRILYLPPGAYTFGARTSFPDGDGGATWELRCLMSETGLIWQKHLNASSEQRSAEVWRISPKCTAQLLTLVVTSGQAQVDTTIIVGDLSLS